jgi:hypothetical protein
MADGWAVCICKKWNAIQKNNFVLKNALLLPRSAPIPEVGRMLASKEQYSAKCRAGMDLWCGRTQGFPALKQGRMLSFVGKTGCCIFFNAMISSNKTTKNAAWCMTWISAHGWGAVIVNRYN